MRSIGLGRARMVSVALAAMTVSGAPASGALAAVPTAAPGTRSSVRFRSCDANVQCATVRVPLDPSRPGGEKISLFVSRRPATDPTQRIGVLFVNPGGPGGPAFDLVRSADSIVTREVLGRFDIIGVDPRGTERSAPLRCSFAAVDEGTLVAPADRSAVERNRAAAANLGKACAASDGRKLRFMDTTTAARDLEAVRVALGEPRISFLGMSYGTYLGAVYESLFPQRTRSVVLDSAIDPTRFGVNQILDPIAQSETSLSAFLAACTNGSLSPCSFNDGTDLSAKYVRVRQAYLSSVRNPDRAETEFDGTIDSLVGYPRNGWPILGRALEELSRGEDANFEATAADNLSSVGAGSERSVPLDTFSSTTNAAILCRDAILPRAAGAAQSILEQVPVVAPRFSGLRSQAASAVTCSQWPVAAAALTPLRRGAAITLVLGNNYDPTTPIVWSQSLAAQLGAALLVRNGGGHVAVDKSECVRQAVARFLIDGAIPATGTVCSPDLANPT